MAAPPRACVPSELLLCTQKPVPHRSSSQRSLKDPEDPDLIPPGQQGAAGSTATSVVQYWPVSVA